MLLRLLDPVCETAILDSIVVGGFGSTYETVVLDLSVVAGGAAVAATATFSCGYGSRSGYGLAAVSGFGSAVFGSGDVVSTIRSYRGLQLLQGSNLFTRSRSRLLYAEEQQVMDLEVAHLTNKLRTKEDNFHACSTSMHHTGRGKESP